MCRSVVITFMGISSVIVFRWMPQDTAVGKTLLVRVMHWRPWLHSDMQQAITQSNTDPGLCRQ